MKLSIVTFVLLGVCLKAQIDTTITSGRILQDILEESSIDLEEDYLYDQLEELSDNPIELNKATIDQLLTIPFLDLNSAKLIIDYRKEYGKFYSTNELKLIDGLDNDMAEVLRLFTTVEKYEPEQGFTISDYSLELRSRFIKDLQSRRGFEEGDYLGNEFKSYQRLKFRSSSINASTLVEKDAGEKKFNDFTSYSVSLNNFHFINKLALGDYLIEFGQGLIYWGPYSFGKGAEAVRTVSRSARTIRDYTSTDENQFFRGGAVQLNFSKINFSFFYSDHSIDGNIDTAAGLITSLPVSGYHRTTNEIAKVDLVKEKAIGGIISFEIFDGLNIGAAYQNIKYDRALAKDGIYDPQGSQFTFYSFSYSWIVNNFRFSGETAYNQISAANIHNLEWILSNEFSLMTSIRSYPRNFFSIRGTGFGESSNTSNEFGVYNGIRWRSDFGVFNFYYDQFKFPTASFYSKFPSTGDEFLLDYQVRPFKKTLLNIRIKRENKEISDEINGNEITLNQSRTNFRINYDYYVTKNVRMRSRLEYVFFDQTKINNHEKGYLIFQDIRYDPLENLRFYGRIVLFDTESYNSRVYQFENDVRGILYNPALFGQGTRWYLIIEYDFLNYFKVSAKYSELYKPDEFLIGSGLNEISGNLDNRFTLQLDINF